MVKRPTNYWREFSPPEQSADAVGFGEWQRFVWLEGEHIGSDRKRSLNHALAK